MTAWMERLLLMSAQAAVLILCILLLQRLSRGHISPRLSYALWLLPLLRLLLPFRFSSALSLMNLMPESARQAVLPDVPPTPGMVEVTIPAPSPLDGGFPIQGSPAAAPAAQPGGPALMEILFYIWLLGAAAVFLYTLFINLRFRLGVARRREPVPQGETRIPVYRVAGLPSPCLCGLLRPMILVNDRAMAQGAVFKLVLRHELCHLRAGDPWWGLLRNLCLTLHWFNPLAWLAAFKSRADCELACDERVMEGFDQAQREAYGMALISIIRMENRRSLVEEGTGMDAGRLRARMENIGRRPRRLLGVSLLISTLAITALLAAGAEGRAPHAAADIVEINPGTAPSPSPSPSSMPELAYTRRSLMLESHPSDYLDSADIYKQGSVILDRPPEAVDETSLRLMSQIPVDLDGDGRQELLESWEYWDEEGSQQLLFVNDGESLWAHVFETPREVSLLLYDIYPATAEGPARITLLQCPQWDERGQALGAVEAAFLTLEGPELLAVDTEPAYYARYLRYLAAWDAYYALDDTGRLQQGAVGRNWGEDTERFLALSRAEIRARLPRLDLPGGFSLQRQEPLWLNTDGDAQGIADIVFYQSLLYGEGMEALLLVEMEGDYIMRGSFPQSLLTLALAFPPGSSGFESFAADGEGAPALYLRFFTSDGEDTAYIRLSPEAGALAQSSLEAAEWERLEGEAYTITGYVPEGAVQ